MRSGRILNSTDVFRARGTNLCTCIPRRGLGVNALEGVTEIEREREKWRSVARRVPYHEE